MKTGSYDFIIRKDSRNPVEKPLIPVRTGWINKYTSIEVKLSDAWSYLWTEAKANTDIQKLCGYTLDPVKCCIIRIGVNNGWNADPIKNKYVPGVVHLYAYLTVNGSRYTMPGYGKFYIGAVQTEHKFYIGHQLNSQGYPFFKVYQSNGLASLSDFINRSVMFPVSFKDKGLGGWEMYPYVEYGKDMKGAPVDLYGQMYFSEFEKKDDLWINSHL